MTIQFGLKTIQNGRGKDMDTNQLTGFTKEKSLIKVIETFSEITEQS